MIEVKADERFFTVLCALNLCGYDDKNKNVFQPVRRSVRKALKAKKLKSGKALCRFIRRVGGDSFFIGYSVHLSQPPVFKLAVKTEIKSESALKKLSEMKEFEELLTVFYKEAGIHSL